MKKDKLEHIKKSGFETPKEYFETIEDAVFTKIASDKFPKKEGFEYPVSYFDAIEDVVFKKLNIDKKQKETGFKIPENYLKTIEDNVLKTVNSNKKEPKVIDFKSVFLKRIIPFAAAASLLVFIYLNYNQSSDTHLDQLAATEIEQWIDDELITFDTYEITEVFDDVEFENQPTFEDDEILDYLNGTDIESLTPEN